MSSIIRRGIPWTQQPPAGTSIDWSNPLYNGLVALIDPNAGIELVTRSKCTATRVSRLVTSKGIGMRADSVSIGYGITGPTVNGLSSSDLTDIVFIGSHSHPSPSYTYACGNYNGTAGVGIFTQHTAVGGQWGIYDGIGLLSGLSTLVEGGSYLLAHVRSNGIHYVYKNGILVNSLSGAYNSASNAPFSCNTLSAATSIPWSDQSAIMYAARWGRGLSAAEISLLSANPWQIFQP